jgi:lysophospholipase
MALVMTSMDETHVPEARVLIIMTGGTICMQKSPDGLVPARNFLERCMAPRPEFNDGKTHEPIEVALRDGSDGVALSQSLETPTSVYGKRVRSVPLSLQVALSPKDFHRPAC